MTIYEQAKAAAEEIAKTACLKEGDTLVIGCSTSEVLGGRIGTVRSPETAEEIYKGIADAISDKGIFIAAQCCEHLNRAIITERENAEKHGWEIVCAVPYPHAGGSFATVTYHHLKDPVAVEEIKAEAGLDIGSTLIGMHLKRVAVPVRLKNDFIGEAKITAARTRPKYIGGERTKYE
ncbi:MAG: TIGR01440 family protein [Clostridia bacterium]|nr:TIGR01440 family protein [Clostridia bacterium]